MDWLQQYIFPAEARVVSPAFVRAGTRLAALEMIESGTTTYADMYYFEEEIARLKEERGARLDTDLDAAALRDHEDVKEFYLGLSGGDRKSFRDIKSYKRRKRWL